MIIWASQNVGKSVQKNAIINSFIETQRLTLSQEKNVVLHIGRKVKCKMTYPTLKVHDHDMKVVTTQKYLGDIVSSSGSLRDTIEDRRNKGWGKLSEISGILAEMPDTRRIEVGLNLRMAKLINGTIYSSEAWSKITENELTRLEQVDLALLRSIVSGHSKTSRAFILLEFGVFGVRYLIMIRRLMYHYHLVTRSNNELIKKVYMKQKESSIKGDWFRTLQDDFKFIGEEITDDKIATFSKPQYKLYIQDKVKIAAFHAYLALKEKSKKKLKSLEYTSLNIQPYLISEKFSSKQIKLLYSLRPNAIQQKINLRKCIKEI